jgi:hypothetical protein
VPAAPAAAAPLRIVGSGSGSYSGSTWIWSPDNVSRANAKHDIFDVWGTACTWSHNHTVLAHFEIGGWWQCGGPWRCPANDAACSTRVAPPGIAEWGFDYHNLGPTFPACFEILPVSGGVPILPCCNLSSPAYAHNPAATPTEAADRLRLYFRCLHAAAADRPSSAIAPAGFDALSGHYFYWAHAVDFASATTRPVSRILSELCENINSINGHLAWTRGLARQYGLPWGVDVSTWYGGFVPDFGASIHPWAGAAGAAGAAGGHSGSLLKRTYYAVAAAGASLMYQESADNYVFLPGSSATDGVFDLSPLGMMDQEFTRIARGDKNRGEPLAPFAVLLEQNHGMGLGWWYQSRAWEAVAEGGFPLTQPQQVATLLLETLWPGSWRVQWDSSMNGIPKLFAPAPEASYMVASPFGDLVDILAPKNLSTTFLLANYKVLMLAGGVEVDTFVSSSVLSGFVEGGGTLVLTSDLLTASKPLSDWVAQRTGIEVAVEKVTRLVAGAQAGASSKDRWRVASQDVTATPPVCAPIFGAAATVWTGRFYIKTGGDRSKLRGWDAGVLDKCCRNRTAPGSSSCWEFGSLAECSAALKTAARSCAACVAASDEPDSNTTLFCPMWRDGASVTITPLLHPLRPHVQILAEFQGHQEPEGGEKGVTIAGTYPAVVSASASSAGLGGGAAGRVVVALVNDATSLQAYRLLQDAVLAPLLDELAPLELLLAKNGLDARPLVQMMINRVATGFNVTLINNRGVTKGPKTPAVVDPSAGVAVLLRLKVGIMTEAFSTRLPVKKLEVLGKNTVSVAIPAGDVALVSITLATSAHLKTDDTARKTDAYNAAVSSNTSRFPVFKWRARVMGGGAKTTNFGFIMNKHHENFLTTASNGTEWSAVGNFEIGHVAVRLQEYPNMQLAAAHGAESSGFADFPALVTFFGVLSQPLRAGATQVEVEVTPTETPSITTTLSATLLQIAGNTTYLGIMAGRDVVTGAPRIETMRSFNKRHYWQLTESLPRVKTPNTIIFADSFNGDDDQGLWTDTLEAMNRLGMASVDTGDYQPANSINSFWGGFPPNGALNNFTRPFFKNLTGLQHVAGGSCLQRQPNDPSPDVFRNSWAPNSVFALNASQRTVLINTMCRGQSSNRDQFNLLWDGYSKIDISIGAMVDEPLAGSIGGGAGLPPVSHNAIVSQRWMLYLQSQGLKPATDFGKSSWPQVLPAGRPLNPGDGNSSNLISRKQFYWTARFVAWDATATYAAATNISREAFSQEVLVYANLDNSGGRFFCPNTPLPGNWYVSSDSAVNFDWQEFGRMSAASLLFTEDW